MTVARALLPAIALIVTAGAAYPAAADHGLKIPPDFRVTEFAGPDLANDVYTLHISREGRVMVAGRGYVRELIDTDAGGKADRAADLVTGLRDGPMGILSEGEVLYLVADGGLKRYQLRPGKSKAAES